MPKSRPLVITLDGPAASGKSSVAKAIALELKIPFISSGLLYRAAAKLVVDSATNPDSEVDILKTLQQHNIQLRTTATGENLISDGELDLTNQLHTEDIDNNSSKVAKHPEVRNWVNARLQNITGDLVIDGRDMGHVVFPDASHKFYLTATAEVRALRRLGERSAELEEITQAIIERDRRDAKNLEPAVDAIHIDTSELTLDEVISTVLGYIKGNAKDD